MLSQVVCRRAVELRRDVLRVQDLQGSPASGTGATISVPLYFVRRMIYCCAYHYVQQSKWYIVADWYCTYLSVVTGTADHGDGGASLI